LKLKQFFQNELGKSKGVLGIVIACSAILTLLTAYTLVPLQYSIAAQPVGPLDPLTIPKFVNQLMGPPPVYEQIVPNQYAVNMTEFFQQILPTKDEFGVPTGFPMTKVWGYGGPAKDAVTGAYLGYVENSPGPSFEVTKGTGIWVNWTNMITTPLQFGVDPTLHWSNPNQIAMPGPGTWPIPPPAPADDYWGAQSPATLVPHLHGGEVPPVSDGGPDAWWTNGGIQGPGYSTAVPTSPNSAVYYYPNINPASTLWYHDHALGITRLNVMSGLAGFCIVRDPADTVAPLLPTGKYDMPLVFQDRSFFTDGSFNFPYLGVQPAVHPYWVPEFFGDTIMVNGLVWPNMDVDQAAYRFRLLDGSNARFYTISLVINPGPTETILPFTQIASDGGYLTAPVTGMTQLTFAPGERVEILVDFTGLAPGTKILLRNTANENFPFGLPVNPNTVGQLMQFTVTANTGDPAPTLPPNLNPTLPVFPTLGAPTLYRMLTLVEVLDPVTGVPLELLMDGQKWTAFPSEIARVGDTEEWIVFNPTADSHPIHLHLVQFQLISRQAFKAKVYYADWLRINGGTLPLTLPTKNIMYLHQKYQVQPPVGPPPEEQGWKDTIMMHPNEITRIRVRFAPTEAPITGPSAPVPGDINTYPFDVIAPHGPGPGIPYGYVWHCHIIDHEDNEMMRPLQISTTSSGGSTVPPTIAYKGKPATIPPPRPIPPV
jgi:FtsP/CotA-like multicopper oxidase with cupredoxin domain